MTNPLGAPVPEFKPPPAPMFDKLPGSFVTLERLDSSRHAEQLFAANKGVDALWDYLGYGPFTDLDTYRDWQKQMALADDPAFYAMRDAASGLVGGLASFLRIDRPNGVLEIGHIQISPAMQRTRAASEAIMLMIRWAFEAGYRRVEWKCNDLNAPSMRAAERYGFRYEGTFRNHLIVKGRNRDTAWWAITDDDWPTLEPAYIRWLGDANFIQGKQQRSLSEMIDDERGKAV